MKRTRRPRDLQIHPLTWTMPTESLRRRLASGRVSLGSWLTFSDPAAAEILAGAGFEWLVVDLEHSALGMESAAGLIRTASLSGAAPLARLSANDPVQAKRVMDAGAWGVVAPMVNTAEEARAAVSAVKYPPQGRRGVGMYRAQGYGAAFDEYVRGANGRSLVVVQVEHIRAVENIEAILSVPGVDAFLVGPYDLSGSMGIPGRLDHPRMDAAIARVLAAASASKVPAGIHIVRPDPAELRRRVRQGFRFIAYGVDFLFLGDACRAAAREGAGAGR